MHDEFKIEKCIDARVSKTDSKIKKMSSEIVESKMKKTHGVVFCSGTESELRLSTRTLDLSSWSIIDGFYKRVMR